ncbi:enoyl-CoA hydratase/isomerase family protein [Pseudomaricurvus alkylphenolicus]|uniref:enoyl-CoA hydratase/isomerase family protein n=1 Tax=Pseudomaricurvus alkylphenolicus TaxID=1306991 RepID=UPI00141DD550|nr:enoyl-CoA hydratase/isomerase family protein [Pseudomaricurvus alkylphenolicus]NIB44116.1 enoyl-CoA hydratase/isomerase family protein [Pseudomaricurvus alkylphenolicus]
MTSKSVRTEIVNDSVSLEVEGSIGWVVLTRPDQINAINDDIRTGVPNALQTLDGNPEIRVIVIRGQGERGFCAGADIKEIRPPETSIETRQRMGSNRWIESLDRIEKPVIAAIHGYCMGGGLELALACDIRMAAPGAVMSLPETALGLIPGGGGTQRLPRTVGQAKAMDMMLTGARLNAKEALAIDLVTRMATSDTSLLDDVRALAQVIGQRPPVATRFVKRAVAAANDLELSKGFDLELDLFAFLKTSSDAKEAALAFKEKREPNFSGN